MITVFKQLLKTPYWVFLLGLILGCGFAKVRYTAQIHALNAQHEQVKREFLAQHEHALQTALIEQQKWQAFAQKQGEALAKAQNALDIQTAQNKREIKDAIQKDVSNGDCVSGIGDNGLQLYKKAFGY